MYCEICGRATCMPSFHTIEDQISFDEQQEEE
jgi:hypothetical protein